MMWVLPKATESVCVVRGTESASIVSEKTNDPQGKPAGFPERDTRKSLLLWAEKIADNDSTKTSDGSKSQT